MATQLSKVNSFYISRKDRQKWDGYLITNTLKEHMMQDLKAMMADADTEKERRRIKEFIEDMQEMK